MGKELKNITHNIAWLRKKNNFTKRQMALLLGISVKSLSKIEKGEACRKLNSKTIFIIINLNVTPMRTMKFKRKNRTVTGHFSEHTYKVSITI